MNVKIGIKIKELRKRDNVTQEKLADVLGVTSQAISKWESESGYPDIEYITPVANFFNVTIDYLFNYDAAEKRKKIDQCCEGAKQKLPQERIDMMRQALVEFPGEEKLLFTLADALYDKWKVARHIFDGETHIEIESEGWKEPAAVFEKLLASSADDSIRIKCRWYLAMIYGKLGEKEKVIEIAENFDPVCRSREVVLADAARRSKDREIYQQEAILALLYSFEIIFHSFTDDLTNSNSQTLNPDIIDDLNYDIRCEAKDIIIDLYKKINKFIFKNDNYSLNRSIMNSYCSYALYLITEQEINEAFEKLESAYKHAKNCDNRFDEKGEHLMKDNPDNSKIRFLPNLLYELKSEYGGIAVPADPQLCNDPRYTGLISKIETDIADYNRL